jgi:hypothetical protein
MIRNHYGIVIVLACAVLLNGCGASKPAVPAAPTASPTSPAVTTTSKSAGPEGPPLAAPKIVNAAPAKPEPTAKKLDAKEFEQKFAEIQKLEESGSFSEAFRLGSELQIALDNDPRAQQVDEALQRLRAEKRAMADLSFALKNLVADEPATAQIAAQKFIDSGDAGALVLRQAVRNEDDAIATQAAQLLAKMHDPKAAPALTERLLKNPPDPLRGALAGALADNVERIDPSLLAKLFAAAKDDPDFKQRAGMGLVVAAFDKLWHRNAEECNTALSDAQAAERLKAYVESAVRSTQPDVVSWGAQYAEIMGALASGLHGYYFEGDNFEKLVLEQLDEKIDVPDRKFPMPGGRQDHISVRWTGSIAIAKSGKYTFFAASDDGNRIWIDAKLINDDWGYHGAAEKSGEIELTAGLHDFKVEYMQGEGGATIQVQWKGPDFEKKLLTSEVLRTLPIPKK